MAGADRLQALSRYFVHSGETADQVAVLARTAKHLMNWVMRPLGSLLTTLPLRSERPGVLAGPAFEIVQPSFYVLPIARRPGGSWPSGWGSWPTGPSGSAGRLGWNSSPSWPPTCAAWRRTSGRPDIRPY